MRKNLLLFFLGFFVLVGIVLFGGLVWWKGNISAVSGSNEKINFLITKGSSAMQVANKLYENNLIKSPLAFKIYVQVAGKASYINAGEFRLSRDMTLSEIVDALGKGPYELWVTIPEGLRREEIIVKFIEGLEMDSQQAEVFAKDFLIASEGKEGYLFPDTYLFPKDTTASMAIEKMISTFESKIDKEARERIEESNYSLNDHVIMASIIERETITDEERPVVAGILWKRLETEGWLVQADATIQYDIGSKNCKGRELICDDWWPILTKDDLEIPSFYNSYLNDWLPPTPIANPGLSSLKASIFPKSSDYWFYIHDPEGNIHYGESIEEHNRNVRVYLGK